MSVSGMTFALTGGGIYAFRFLICYRIGSTAVGLKVSLFGGAAGVLSELVAAVKIPQGGAGTNLYYENQIVAVTGGVAGAVSTPTVNTTYVAKLSGIAVCSSAGNLVLQAAINPSTLAASGLIIRKGTMGNVWRIA